MEPRVGMEVLGGDVFPDRKGRITGFAWTPDGPHLVVHFEGDTWDTLIQAILFDWDSALYRWVCRI